MIIVIYHVLKLDHPIKSYSGINFNRLICIHTNCRHPISFRPMPEVPGPNEKAQILYQNYQLHV